MLAPFHIAVIDLPKAGPAAHLVADLVFTAAQVYVRGDQVVLGCGDAAEDLGGLVDLFVQPELFDDGLYQAPGVDGVIDGKGGREPEHLRLAPEDACKKGMKGAHPQVPGQCRIHHGADALLHLIGRLVGEGQGQDAMGRNTQRKQVSNTVSEHPGLPGPRPGNDQGRSLVIQYCFLLRLVQIPSDFFHFLSSFCPRSVCFVSVSRSFPRRAFALPRADG